MWDASKCNLCGDCLIRCRYVDYDKDKAVVEIKLLMEGEEADILNKCTGSRFNEATIDKVVRNTASSWTQSGHLEGRTFKIRRSVTPTPAVATFALLMGYILGARGDVLFETLWAKILDVSKEELIQIATDAKRFGYLDIKASGGIVDVSFHRLLTEEERRLIHGAN